MKVLPVVDNEFVKAYRELQTLRELLDGIIVGQDDIVTQLIIAIFSGGHVLLEGLPGLGKTHLAKALATALGLRWSRVQCTPDLLPADITGAEVLTTGAAGESRFEFRPGPVFAELVLVDEINRSTPRTQSALLEAMQEMCVTHAGVKHRLPSPFCVLATQNPIELEGTYPLPEAQLDRFMFKLVVRFPRADALRSMLDVSLDVEPADTLEPIAARADVLRLIGLCRTTLIAERCKEAAVQLILATQPDSNASTSAARSHIRYGASPRALQALVRAARVHAVMSGRAHVDVLDLEAVALPVLRHRILLRLESELEGVQADSLLSSLIDEWRQQL